MPIDALNDFKTAFQALPKVTDTSFAANLAGYMGARSTGKAGLSGVTLMSGSAFTFNNSVYQANALTAINLAGFALAFNLAVAASTFLVLPGTYIGAPLPTTTWSVINSVVFDPASLTLAQAKINELAGLGNNFSDADTPFPVKHRDAFLLLTVTIMGMDSTAPTPIALNAPGVALL